MSGDVFVLYWISLPLGNFKTSFLYYLIRVVLLNEVTVHMK